MMENWKLGILLDGKAENKTMEKVANASTTKDKVANALTLVFRCDKLRISCLIVHMILSLVCLYFIVSKSNSDCGLTSIETYYLKFNHIYSYEKRCWTPLCRISPILFITLFECITAAYCMAYCGWFTASRVFLLILIACCGWLPFAPNIPINNVIYFAFPSLFLSLFSVWWFEKHTAELAAEGMRYIEYGITASLLIVSFCTPIVPLFTTLDACIIYLSVALLNYGMGLVIFRQPFSFSRGSQVYVFMSSWTLFAVSWMRFWDSVSTPFVTKYAPPVAWASIAILFGGYFLFGLMHLAAYFLLWPTEKYVKCLDVLSLVVKMILSILALSTNLFAFGRTC
jgi:hypothetical protein